ncbi:MAG: amino acid ABC transporter ATP-binding protein [Synechococcaceae cyanobacterium RM1_1_27]|nr:amino acid ABC transporter ATP-binding protein [Synechococcaceae cyanobacterium SM2_3_2]NJO85580.1 amino acid ABC transporter ATP-binding protein [Synechococcaceae cyanobacterium RM1_1_27]
MIKSTTEPAITVTDLHKSFGSLEVLKGISTEIFEGTVVAIIGPSGCGKSTFLRCLNRLEMPSSGQILIDGINIADPTVNILKVRQRVGMVFQHFNIFPHMTVLQNLTYAPIKVKGIPASEAKDKAKDLLDRVGLADKADVFPSKLSGGQKQRVAIARSLAMEPQVMLFDEPTSALDPEMVREVLDVIKSLTQLKMTLAIVTHEMAFAREVADRICFFDGGLLVEDSHPTDFFSQPKSDRARQFLEKML